MNPKTKAKLMEMFSEALDKEAYVSIHFTQYEKVNDFKPVFKNEVEDKANEIADMLSVNVQKSVSDSFNIDTDYIHLCFSYLPPENAAGYMEEDVFLEEDAV
ncbi:hypothetical protein [Peribacillus simplex]|uniref:hypothetical protein n=1 Tax=Peribacillus simplex TaxID=1478 RepID=UPI003D2E15D0